MGEGFFAQGLVFEAYCHVFGLGRVRIPDGVISGMVGIWLIVLFSLSRGENWEKMKINQRKGSETKLVETLKI